MPTPTAKTPISPQPVASAKANWPMATAPMHTSASVLAGIRSPSQPPTSDTQTPVSASRLSISAASALGTPRSIRCCGAKAWAEVFMSRYVV